MSFLLTMTAAVALGAASPPHSGDTSQTIVVEGIRDQRKPANDYLDKLIPPVFDANSAALKIGCARPRSGCPRT